MLRAGCLALWLTLSFQGEKSEQLVLHFVRLFHCETEKAMKPSIYFIILDNHPSLKYFQVLDNQNPHLIVFPFRMRQIRRSSYVHFLLT